MLFILLISVCTSIPVEKINVLPTDGVEHVIQDISKLHMEKILSEVEVEVPETKVGSGESVIVMTNQGRFGPAAGGDGAFRTRSSITPEAMLQKTGGRDPEATLEKAWGKGVPHVTLLMQFSDGNCEQMEWYPHDGATATLGEHSSGEARLHPRPALFRDGSQCRDSASFLDMTDETAKVQFGAFVELHAHKQKVDVFKWSAAAPHAHGGEDEKITRRQLYSAFLEEARRYKDEEKYSCPSFVNNVFGIATGQSPYPSSKMVSLIKMASKLGFTKDLPEGWTKIWNLDGDRTCVTATRVYGAEFGDFTTDMVSGGLSWYCATYCNNHYPNEAKYADFWPNHGGATDIWCNCYTSCDEPLRDVSVNAISSGGNVVTMTVLPLCGPAPVGKQFIVDCNWMGVCDRTSETTVCAQDPCRDDECFEDESFEDAKCVPVSSLQDILSYKRDCKKKPKSECQSWPCRWIG